MYSQFSQILQIFQLNFRVTYMAHIISLIILHSKIILVNNTTCEALYCAILHSLLLVLLLSSWHAGQQWACLLINRSREIRIHFIGQQHDLLIQSYWLKYPGYIILWKLSYQNCLRFLRFNFVHWLLYAFLSKSHVVEWQDILERYMATEPIATAYFTNSPHQSVCLYVYPLYRW
jgi:hypothetical protein